MKKIKIPIIVISSILAVIIVGITMFSYIDYVRVSLWEKSVNDILESTSQEEKTLNIYIEKDIENLENILIDIQNNNYDLSKRIASIPQDENIHYTYVDVSQKIYIDKTGKNSITNQDIINLQAKCQSNNGIIDPYINHFTGVKVIGTYVKEGNSYLIKESRVSYIAKEFSLSFYNDLGFSYVVNKDGNVLVRSNHKNANRTFQNLFDIIDLEGNDSASIQSFKEALSHQQSGIALFNYRNDANVFCYVPLYGIDQWYIVSIIPNDVIMKQANYIIMYTIILSLIIMGSIGCVILLYIFNQRKHKMVVEKLAYYDQLTSIYNYQKFKIEGESLLSHKHRKWAVIYLDIAGFKVINDLNGYQFGDKVLCQIASILQKYMNNEAIACHMNADKFLFMCKYESKEDIETLCHQINHDFQDALSEYGLEKETVIKLGVCCQEDDTFIQTIEHMVDRSHLALVNLSQNPNGFYCFYNYQMRERMLREADIETKMDRALYNQEFIFYLQPKFNVEGSQILGAEALVRWIDSQKQMYMPNEFISLFERNGFILRLDEYIFEKVCQYLSTRLKHNQKCIPISVNISRLHLYQPDFIERYVKIKDKYHIPDQLLELEITENILLDNIKKVQKIVRELQKYGFMCSIDDFGSGYSSLNSLKDLPIDIIKLDRLFLENSYNMKRSQEIVKSVINMAKNINIKTVAEGVETTQQQEFLVAIGCDMIQGYVFSKPVSIEEFEKLFVD